MDTQEMTQAPTTLEEVFERLSPEEKQRAEGVVRDYHWRDLQFLDRLENPRFIERHDSFWFKRRVEEEEREQWRDYLLAKDEIENHRMLRAFRFAEIDAWSKRQRVALRDVGSASVLQPSLLKFLKAAKKLAPTDKVIKPHKWLVQSEFEQVVYGMRVKRPIPSLQTVTLDFAEDRIIAYVWTVDVSGSGFGLSTLVERCACAVTLPFTMRVDLDTLIEIVKESEPDNIDLRADDLYLHIEQWRSRTRLARVVIHPMTAGYWNGFLPAAE